MIPIIVDGVSPENQCFPPALRLRLGPGDPLSDNFEEPIAADARPQGDGKEVAKQKVIAALLGLRLDEIVRRAERARKRRNRIWAAIAGVFLLLTVAATGSAVYAWQQLKTNEAFLSATLKRATEIIKTAVTQAQQYHVPKAATVELLEKAEGLFDDMAKLGRPTQQLRLRKAELLLVFAGSYASLGKTNAQREHALASLDLIQALAKESPHDEEVQYTLGLAFAEVGDVFKRQGHLEEALAQYRVSLVIGKRLSASLDAATSNKGRSIQSVSYERMGDMLQMQGHLDEAIEYYRSDVLLQPNPSPFLYERAGYVLFAQGKKDEALRNFRQELAAYEHLTSSDSENAEWRHGLSAAHHYIGMVLLAQGKIEEALAEFRTDLNLIKELADTDRTNKSWQRDFALAYGMIGDALIAEGNIQQAVENYKSRVSLVEHLVANDLQNVVLQLDLAVSYASLADAYIAQGKLDEAFSNYRKSHPILERSCESDPSNVDRQLDLLWSHSRLALFGDSPLERFKFIVATLGELKRQNKLTAEQQRWLPVAQQGLAAVDPENKQWQWDLLQMYWRSASFTINPVREAALVVAMSRKLREENKLTAEQAEWISIAESQLESMRGNNNATARGDHPL